MAANACIKCWFVFVNSLFLAIGAAVVGLGIWVLVDKTTTVPGVDTVIGYFRTNAILTYISMGVGGLMFLVGLIGTIGGCKDSTCLLKLFLSIAILLFLVQLAIVLILAVPQILALLVPYFKLAWIAPGNEATRDLIQLELKCCGFTDASEYTSIPNSCMSSTTGTPATTAAAATTATAATAATAGTVGPTATTATGSNYYTDGCYDKLNAWFQSIAMYFYIAAGVLLALELWQMISVCCLTSGINKERRVGDADMQMYPPPGRTRPNYNRPMY
ncbi:CD82 antigen-like isoform X2 [Branchiostoma floridae]|uniref:Tetraspanin n=1 Tax=Branchiostoma floridae TaxID=7739 RepID=A0A9J7HY75_BRAFL|nr:CD82 antigen-like isoform X2 [Branchiostoma floridae]